MSHSRGEGRYRGADGNELSSTVTGLYPDGRYRLAAGYRLRSNPRANTLDLRPRKAELPGDGSRLHPGRQRRADDSFQAGRNRLSVRPGRGAGRTLRYIPLRAPGMRFRLDLPTTPACLRGGRAQQFVELAVVEIA